MQQKPSLGRVWYLHVGKEADVEVLVHLDVVDTAADGRHHDDQSLLSLELFH